MSESALASPALLEDALSEDDKSALPSSSLSGEGRWLSSSLLKDFGAAGARFFPEDVASVDVASPAIWKPLELNLGLLGDAFVAPVPPPYILCWSGKQEAESLIKARLCKFRRIWWGTSSIVEALAGC